MKILIITAAFPPEPVVSSFISYDLATELAVNNEVTVICPKPTRPCGTDFSSNNIQVNQTSFERIQLASFTSPKYGYLGRIRESYSIGKHTQRHIEQNHSDIDILYINTWPLFGQYFAIRAAKKFNLPAVIHIQDIYPESLMEKLPVFKKLIYRLLLPIDKFIQQNAAKVITISQAMRSLLVESRELEEDKVEVVYNWQNEDKFLNYQKSKDSVQKNLSFTFMFLGSLNVTAAVHNLIKAFSKASLVNARLVIAGNGTEKNSLINLATTYPDANIEFWDAQIQKVPEIQDQADVLLLNLSKGAARFAMPSKLPAYLFSEKPIIASVDEDSDTAKLILNANCGWVVPPDDIDRLANAMKDAALTPGVILKNYGKSGFSFSIEKLSKKTNLQKLVSIIENTIKIKK